MTKNNILWVAVAIALAAVYIIFFSNWFTPKTIQIYHTNRNLRSAPVQGNALPNLMFGMRPSNSRLTEIKVVSVTALETNKDTVPLWHLISDSNSVPLKYFFYGQHIAGMRPAIKGMGCEALETNVTYRMFLTAGRIKGEHDFELK